MSDFFRPETGDQQFLEAAGSQQEVFIALGDASKRAKVVRDDFAVPVFEVDEELFDDFFAGRPRIVNKVVSQSIKPGTVVNVGTAIDLVMAPSSSVPGNIFQGGHIVLRDQTISTVYDTYVRGNVSVGRMLSRRASPADLTADDVALIEQLVTEQQVSLSDTPGQTAEDVFVSWQLANTFTD